MDSSKCPRCGSENFQMVDSNLFEPNSQYPLRFVQCSSCKSVIAVLDYFNLGKLIRDQQTDISQLKKLGSQILSEIEDLKSDHK